MSGRDSVKVKYLDTSSIVKLYLEEDDSDKMRQFYSSDSSICTTRLTFYESLNVLKARLFKNSTKPDYYNKIEKLIIQGWGGKLEIEDIEITNRDVFLYVKDIAIKYDLDLADAIQLYAILHGKYKRFCSGSASVLVTADDKQQKAAEKLDIRVWNIAKDKQPNWL